MRTLRAPHHGEPEPAARRQPSPLFRSSAEASAACANLSEKWGWVSAGHLARGEKLAAARGHTASCPREGVSEYDRLAPLGARGNQVDGTAGELFYAAQVPFRLAREF